MDLSSLIDEQRKSELDRSDGSSWDKICFTYNRGIDLYDREFNGRLFSILNDLPEKRLIFDIGAGSGKAIKELREMGWEASGVGLVEYSSDMGANIIIGDALDVMRRLDSNQFDLIISNMSISYMPEKLGVLAEAYRLLRPEGVALLTLPHNRIYINGQNDNLDLIRPGEFIPFEIRSRCEELSCFPIKKSFVEMKKVEDVESITFPYVLERAEREDGFINSFYRSS